MKGLEPPRPKTLDPKSNAATNYATCAVFRAAKVDIFFVFTKFFHNFTSSFKYCKRIADKNQGSHIEGTGSNSTAHDAQTLKLHRLF